MVPLRSRACKSAVKEPARSAPPRSVRDTPSRASRVSGFWRCTDQGQLPRPGDASSPPHLGLHSRFTQALCSSSSVPVVPLPVCTPLTLFQPEPLHEAPLRTEGHTSEAEDADCDTQTWYRHNVTQSGHLPAKQESTLAWSVVWQHPTAAQGKDLCSKPYHICTVRAREVNLRRGIQRISC